MIAAFPSDPRCRRPELVGAKTANLARAADLGMRVPPGAAVGTGYLLDLLHAAGCDPEDLRRPAELGTCARLRAVVYELAVPEADLDALRRALPSRSVFVRSSHRDEDTAAGSRAGQYSSVGPTGVSDSELGEAILLCLGSAFRPSSLLDDRWTAPDRMGLLVQTALVPNHAGVALSRHPTGDPATMAVELQPGLAGTLVSGATEGTLLAVDRATATASAEHPLGSALADLADAVLRLEDAWGDVVDVEWAVVGGVLHILQVRPVVRPRSGGTSVHPGAAARRVVRRGRGTAREKLDWHLDKRAHLERHLARIGADHERWAAVVVPPTGPHDVAPGEVAAAVGVRTDHVLLAGPGPEPLALVSVDELDGVLGRGAGQTSTEAVFYVLEHHPAAVWGYGRVAGAEVVVEWWRGGPAGARFGAREVERCRLGRDGRVVGDVPPGAPSPEALATIQAWIRALDDALAHPTVEWFTTDAGDPLVWDVTLEQAPLPLADVAAGGEVVSAGRASGPALVLADVSSLEAIASDRSVHMDADYSRASRGEAALRLRSDLLAGPRPVVVARAPATALALIAEDVAGFVFDGGALLCHLAILLREGGIPAAVLPGATERIADGATVVVDDGVVRWFHGEGP